MSISWDEQDKLTTSDAGEDDYFGVVSIDNNYAIVGAYNSGDKGAAYIFKKSDNGETWSEQIKLIGSDSDNDDDFGISVNIHGNYAIVGTENNDSNKGAAYIFKKNSDETWTEQSKLTANDAADNDQFGSGVHIDGNYAIVGARTKATGLKSYAGKAYIFKKIVDENNAETWSEQSAFKSDDLAAQDYFGAAVSIGGNYAIIGAYQKNNGSDSYAGAAYIFKKDDNS